MSIENVKRFYLALAAQPSQRHHLQQLNAAYRGQKLDEPRRQALIQEQVLPVAESMGFPFTVQDLLDYEAETLEQLSQSGQLSMQELEIIGGGAGDSRSCDVLGFAPNISPYWLNGCPLGI